MTTPGGSRRTALALYRCILRWSAQNADVPFSVRASDIRALAPAVLDSSAGALSPAALQDAGAVAAVARAAFREAARASGAEAEATVDRGFEAVQVLNGTYARQLQVRGPFGPRGCVPLVPSLVPSNLAAGEQRPRRRVANGAVTLCIRRFCRARLGCRRCGSCAPTAPTARASSLEWARCLCIRRCGCGGGDGGGVPLNAL